MTVTELREALQKLEAEGKGKAAVFYEDNEFGPEPVEAVLTRRIHGPLGAFDQILLE